MSSLRVVLTPTALFAALAAHGDEIAAQQTRLVQQLSELGIELSFSEGEGGSG
jgi:hypothetical protein